ncbi:MAG TPA: hypothetical protein VGK73_02530 [Polyangiaceae bacterium]
MERERHKPAGHGGRRRGRRAPRPVVDPVIVAARRPPRNAQPTPSAPAPAEPETEAGAVVPSATAKAQEPPPRRSARIVAAPSRDGDLTLRERERLLARLLASEGRSAITRAAEEFRRAGFEFPAEQPVLLQLLEHLDEAEVRASIGTLSGLLSRETPFKRPVFEQRLRRLEDAADEEATRHAAAELRRALRA